MVEVNTINFLGRSLGVTRLLLHAIKLTCAHPITGKTIEIFAPYDKNFEYLFETFGWDSVK